MDLEFGTGELCTHLIIELYARVCFFVMAGIQTFESRLDGGS